jgi:hypothetical protein
MLLMRLRLESKKLNNMLRKQLIVSGISLRLGFTEFIHFYGLLICGLLDFLSFCLQFLDLFGILFSMYFLISFGLVEMFG